MSDELRDVLVATGDTPTAEFRSSLRTRLIEEADDAVVRLAAGSDDAEGRRRVWPLLLAAAAMIAVVVAGVLALGREGDGQLTPATMPRDPGVPSLTTDELLDLAVGRRWVALGSSDTGNDLLATLEIEADRIAGFDGCNRFGGPATWDGDRIASVQYLNIWTPCEGRDGFVPRPGDRLVSDDESRLTVIDGDGIRSTFTAADSLTAITDATDLAGTYLVDAANDPAVLEFDGEGTIRIGSCSYAWDLDAAGRVMFAAPEPATCAETISGANERLTSIAFAGLGDGFDVYRDGNGDGSADGDVLVADQRFVVRLTRSTALDPDAPLVSQVRGITWTLDTVRGEPYPFAILPTLEFQGEAAIVGFDGCSSYELDGGLADGVFDVTPAGDSENLCVATRIVPRPRTDDRARLSDDGSRLTILDTDGRPVTEYFDLGRVRAATADDLLGEGSRREWILEPAFKPFIVDGTIVSFHGCVASGWTVDDGRLSLAGWPEPCITTSTDTTAQMFRGVLDLAAVFPIEARTSDDGGTIYLVGSNVAQLTRFDGSPPDDDSQAVADSLFATTWILDTVDGAPHPFALLPYLDFQRSDALIRGYNGCNWYTAKGDIAVSATGSTLAVDEVISTANACLGPGDRIIAVPRDARLTLNEDRSMLTLADEQGGTTTFVSLVKLPLAEAADLPGTWRLDAGAVGNVAIDPAGSLSFGTCTVGWDGEGGSLTTSSWPDDPYSCLGGVFDETSNRFIELLQGESNVRLEPDALIVADSAFVYRLSNADDSESDS